MPVPRTSTRPASTARARFAPGFMQVLEPLGPAGPGGGAPPQASGAGLQGGSTSLPRRSPGRVLTLYPAPARPCGRRSRALLAHCRGSPPKKVPPLHVQVRCEALPRRSPGQVLGTPHLFAALHVQCSSLPVPRSGTRPSASCRPWTALSEGPGRHVRSGPQAPARPS